ncbi:MAG: sigma-70 family RNA polymerase sigma factor [Myxococcota bacterium]
MFAIICTMFDDMSLLRAWRAGDTEAGNALFERYFSSMHRFFANKSSQGVEDLIQETFLACVNSLSRFREDASFKTYLYGIAVNVLKSNLRKRARAESLDYGVTSIADIGPTPSQFAAQAQERGLLSEVLKHIPVDYQIAIELHYFQDMSGVEIAAALNISEGTVRSRLRRGLARLRRVLHRRGLSCDMFTRLPSSLDINENESLRPL